MRHYALAAAIPAAALGITVSSAALAEEVVDRDFGILARILAGQDGPPPDAATTAEYVRICETYSGGFFYIPGTETCLRITGGVDYQYSRIENTHSMGGGTKVLSGGGPGLEVFGARFGSWIERDGMKLDFRASVRDATRKDSYGGFDIYGGYEGAWGKESYSGNPMVGYDDVTAVGFTYLRPLPGPNTGVIADDPGFGLQSDGELNNSWHRVNLGLKIASPFGVAPSEDGSGYAGFKIKHRIGAFIETLDTEASGRTDLTYGGSVYSGYNQSYELDAKDRYVGLRLGTRVSLPSQLDGKLRFAVSGDLYLGYHTGEGYYSQYTEVSGSPLTQTDSYSKDGFTVGAGLSASATYKFASGWKIGANAEWSCLPDVTSFKAPQNPDEQDYAGFSSERATRIFTGIRLTRSF